MPRILVVDDDPEIRETMSSLIRRQKLEHDAVGSLAETRKKLRSAAYDVVLLDVRLPDGNGLDMLREIRTLPQAPEVVILTGRGDPDGAELAIQGGVWDYLVKPCSIKQISLSLNRALKYHAQKEKEGHLKALDLTGVVGQSAAMRACFNVVAQAASADSSLLVTGETGSGKELFARTVHANSRRVDKPFVVVDCASLTDTLVESTLFGHKKGSFTGAVSDRTGLVVLAHTGTLFLDEVGELPLGIQKALLRVLQERRFRPLGATREVDSDFRLISATNRNLEAMVENGEFRNDLLYRLKTIHLHVPPLRDRRDDIKPLAVHFVAGLCERYTMPLKGFGQDFFEMLQAYDWPGNVRELANVLEQAFVSSDREKTLYALHLPQTLRITVTRAQISAAEPAPESEKHQQGSEPHPRPWPQHHLPETPAVLPCFKDYKATAEAAYLELLVAETAGDVPQMLERSELSRSHLYALLKKYNIEL